MRARVRPVFADKPGLALLHSPDFYSASGCRDMFFHVMEHCYSTSRIAAELGELELDFLGFQLHNAAVAERYRGRFPDDPAMIHLGNWHRFELENPWLFQGMYIFWAQAKT